MNFWQLNQYTDSKEGVQPLTQPQLVTSSSLDPSRHLCPHSTCKNKPTYRQNSAKLFDRVHQSCDIPELLPEKPLISQLKTEFVFASQMTSRHLTSASSPRKRRKLHVPEQHNNILNYFSSKKIEATTEKNISTTTDKTGLFTGRISEKKAQPICRTSEKNIPKSIKTLSDKTDILFERSMEKKAASPSTSSASSPSNTPEKTHLSGVKYGSSTVLNSPTKPIPGTRFLVGDSRKRKSPCVVDLTDSPTTTPEKTRHLSQDQCDNTSKVVPACRNLSDRYGLLGSGNIPERPNYFLSLPVEIVENILCQLPMLDLYLNANRVCRQWLDIISNEEFASWKKLYHKFKLGRESAVSEVNGLMKDNDMEHLENYMCQLVRFMKNFKAVGANMLQCLQGHQHYEAAVDVIAERLPDCLENGKANPWSVVAFLVMLSETVQEIQRIISLMMADSQCTTSKVLECMYCVSTFLFAFKNKREVDIWRGIHYRLYYALYLLENSSAIYLGDLASTFNSKVGQQTIMRYGNANICSQLTHEQSRIVKHPINPDETIKIVAFAGTGKTTTLIRYAQYRPNTEFLLVVYNRSVCDLSKKKFPPNVTCKTGHGLAFMPCGKRYMNKVHGRSKFSSNLKVYPITQTLPLRKGDNQYTRAKFVMDTINNFCASADPFITTVHVPTSRMDDKGIIEIDHATQMRYAEDASHYWDLMTDLKTNRATMTFDGYLKLYQLSKPRLEGYDCILIDEAQDITPALADILLSQTQPKILVGDPHQQIYSFRGAVNAMQQVSAHHVFYLTQSFRFGPEIAYVASCILEFLKGVKKKTLVGSDNKDGVSGDIEGQVAVITRTNFTLFAEAVKVCVHQDRDVKIGIVGGAKNFGFDMILDIYTLMLSPEDRRKDNRIISNELVKKFNSYTEFSEYATRTMDQELTGKIKIVTTYHSELPSIIDKILSKCVRDDTAADILFSTAHKAKGLEFDTVKLTDDYNILPVMMLNQFGVTVGPNIGDESNLVYVAATRAKKRLQMSNDLYKMLFMMGEKFESMRSSKKLVSEGCVFKCIETDAEFSPCTLTLHRKEIKIIGGSVTKPGGVYSPEIVKDQLVTYRKLLSRKDDTEPKEPNINPYPNTQRVIEAMADDDE